MLNLTPNATALASFNKRLAARQRRLDLGSSTALVPWEAPSTPAPHEHDDEQPFSEEEERRVSALSLSLCSLASLSLSLSLCSLTHTSPTRAHRSWRCWR